MDILVLNLELSTLALSTCKVSLALQKIKRVTLAFTFTNISYPYRRSIPGHPLDTQPCWATLTLGSQVPSLQSTHRTGWWEEPETCTVFQMSLIQF